MTCWPSLVMVSPRALAPTGQRHSGTSTQTGSRLFRQRRRPPCRLSPPSSPARGPMGWRARRFSASPKSGAPAALLRSGASAGRPRFCAKRRRGSLPRESDLLADGSRSRRERMEDVDRPADIQALSEPAGARRSGVEAQTLSVVTPPESADRIGGHLGRRWDLGQGSAIRPTEPKRAVEPAMDSVALLRARAGMPAPEQAGIGKRRRFPFRPVAEMVPLREADAAAGKATTSIAMIERPPQGGRNRPGPGPDFDRPPAFVMPHHHAAGIARQTARRFRGNAHTPLEDRNARPIRVGQRRSIDVDHDLVALTGGAGIVTMIEGCLGEQ